MEEEEAYVHVYLYSFCTDFLHLNAVSFGKQNKLCQAVELTYKYKRPTVVAVLQLLILFYSF